jgi:hypothetical protein
MYFSHFQTQRLKSYSWFIVPMFDSNLIQNDFFYQTGGSMFAPLTWNDLEFASLSKFNPEAHELFNLRVFHHFSQFWDFFYVLLLQIRDGFGSDTHGYESGCHYLSHFISNSDTNTNIIEYEYKTNISNTYSIYSIES